MGYGKEIGTHLAKLVVEMVLREEGNHYDQVLTKHGYKYHGTDPDNVTTYHHANGSHVELNGHTGNWAHKGKNKKLVSTTGESAHSLDSHLKKKASQAKSSNTRKERDQAMSDMGMHKVKGSVSGKTYWESTKLTDDELAFLNEDTLQETKKYTHKIWTGPVMAHDKGFIKKMHHHYPNVKSGTEHVYVHTNHNAQHVADTMKHKMGLSGFNPYQFQTKTHEGHKPDKVAEAEIAEVSPPGWSGTTKAMKKHKDISNPFALSWYLKNKGDKPHYKPEKTNESEVDKPGMFVKATAYAHKSKKNKTEKYLESLKKQRAQRELDKYHRDEN